MGGKSLLGVLEVIVMGGSLGGWRKLSGGFWIFKSVLTLQVDMGLGCCAHPPITHLSVRLLLDSFSGSSYTVCLRQWGSQSLGLLTFHSLSLSSVPPFLSILPPVWDLLSQLLSLVSSRCCRQSCWSPELGRGGSTGVSGWDLDRPILSVLAAGN